MRESQLEMAEIQDYIDNHGFLTWLDTAVESVHYGAVTLSAPFKEEFANHSEARVVAHGGILASLFDTACGFSLRSTFDSPDEIKMGTTDMNISYLRPATGDLTAEAEVIREGTSIGVVTGTVYSLHQGEPVSVAAGRATFHIERE